MTDDHVPHCGLRPAVSTVGHVSVSSGVVQEEVRVSDRTHDRIAEDGGGCWWCREEVVIVVVVVWWWNW